MHLGPRFSSHVKGCTGLGRTGMRMITSRSTTSVRTSSDWAAEAKPNIAKKSERRSENGIYAIVSPVFLLWGHRVEQSMNCRGMPEGLAAADSTCETHGPCIQAAHEFIGL